MPKCSILQCSSRKNADKPRLTLHRFPGRNKLLRKKWLDVIGVKNINPQHKDLFVCSLHFTESSFNRTYNILRLHDDVVPSLHLPSNTTLPALHSKPDLCHINDVQGQVLNKLTQTQPHLPRNHLDQLNQETEPKVIPSEELPQSTPRSVTEAPMDSINSTIKTQTLFTPKNLQSPSIWVHRSELIKRQEVCDKQRKKIKLLYEKIRYQMKIIASIKSKEAERIVRQRREIIEGKDWVSGSLRTPSSVLKSVDITPGLSADGHDAGSHFSDLQVEYLEDDEDLLKEENKSKLNEKLPKGKSTIPKGESTIPKGESTIPKGESTIPKDESTIPKGESTIPKGESTIPKGESTIPKGESTIPKDESTIPKGESTIPKGESTIPKDTLTITVEQPNKSYVPKTYGGLTHYSRISRDYSKTNRSIIEQSLKQAGIEIDKQPENTKFFIDIVELKKLTCAICLSLGRKMYSVLHNDNLNTLQQLCDRPFTAEHEICWECNATLNKITHFRKRVRDAQTFFDNNQLMDSPSFSNLERTVITHVTNIDELNANNADIHGETYPEDSCINDTEVISNVGLESTDDKQVPGPPRKLKRNISQSKIEIYRDPFKRQVIDNSKLLCTSLQRKPVLKPRKRKREAYTKHLFVERIVDGKLVITEKDTNKQVCKIKELSEEQLQQLRKDSVRRVIWKRLKYRCDTCIEKFETQEKLVLHNLKHDPDAGVFQCGVCEQRFPEEEECVQHNMKHYHGYKCVCGRLSLSKRTMLAHYERSHYERRRARGQYGLVFKEKELALENIPQTTNEVEF